MTTRCGANLSRYRVARFGTIATAMLFAVPGAIAQPPPDAPAVQQAVTASNLNINPKRLTFDRLGKSAAIYVVNQSRTATAFDVQLIDRLMLPSGQIIPLSEANRNPELKPLVDMLKSAKALLVATPRRVTLGGSTGQTIRVRASSAAEIPPGEYRTHLTVTAIPPADSGLTAEQAAAPRDGQLSFRVDTVIGLSIPVIIRIGPIDVRAGIEHARIGSEKAPATGKVSPTTAVLSFDLVRLGANSLFGDIDVRGNKERGDRDALGTVRGIGVYPEIERRTVKIPLSRIPAHGEQIEIVFRDDDTRPGKQLVRITLLAP